MTIQKDYTPNVVADTGVGDMSPEEFRRHGHEVVNWIADYLEGIEAYPITCNMLPGEIRESLPATAPYIGESFDNILHDFNSKIIPGITHWNHPGFFAYFAITGSGPGILGEMLAAALNVNTMVWQSSPAGVELEELTLDWLRDLVGLPMTFQGVINDTASSSSLYALSAARHTCFPEVRDKGLFATPISRIYASREAHSSIDKAVITLGYGVEGLSRIETDSDFRMNTDALRKAIEEDVESDIRPMALVATLGTTSTGSMDPIDELADIAEEYGVWLHVDAAYAGPAAIVPEFREYFSGWERADSIVLNPHKWLFTPIDCSILYCRRPDKLKSAFSVTPEYLVTKEQSDTISPMDYGIPLGRRLRALKLWFVLRYFGSQGIVERIRAHCSLASVFADLVDKTQGWERVAQVGFSTVVFRYSPLGSLHDTGGIIQGNDNIGSDELQDLVNMNIMDRVNESGEVFLSHTRLNDRVALRFSVGNLRSTETHVRRAWELLTSAADELKTS
jgi:aromatic-L-amino-acid decarboxylase